MRVLIIHDYVVRTGRSGADERLLQLMQSLRMLGHHITFASRECPAPESAEQVTDELRPHVDQLWIGYRSGTEVRDRLQPRLWDADRVAQAQPFSLVIVTLWFWNLVSVAEEYVPMLRKQSPGSSLLCLTDDCHGLRLRKATRRSGLFTDAESAADLEFRELEILSRCDGAVVVSKADAAYLRAKSPLLRLFHIGYAVPVVSRPAAFHARSGVLFLGDFQNRATLEAARWILERVWPLLYSRMPELQLTLAGHCSDTAPLTAGAGVRRLGRVPEVHELLRQTRVFLSPVLFGTGVPTKNLLAMSAGVCLVTTGAGARPLGLVHGRHAFVADGNELQASAVAELHENESLWTQLTQNALSYVSEKFSQECVQRSTEKMIASLAAEEGRNERQSVDAGNKAQFLAKLPTESLEMYVMRRLCLGRRIMKNHPAEALNHLRFALPAMEHLAPSSDAHLCTLQMLGEVYRSIGQRVRGERCQQEYEQVRANPER